MTARINSFGAMLALVFAVAGTGTASAKQALKTRPACCASHPASHAKCCASGKQEACCRAGKSAKTSAAAVCAITGKPLQQCCGKKASPAPPCCQKGCKHSGKVLH